MMPENRSALFGCTARAILPREHLLMECEKYKPGTGLVHVPVCELWPSHSKYVNLNTNVHCDYPVQTPLLTVTGNSLFTFYRTKSMQRISQEYLSPHDGRNWMPFNE